MVVVLMVAEKPSLARSLAEILSRRQCHRRKSMCNACDVYEFDGSFPPGDKRGGSHAKFKMTSVCGHVMSLDFIPKYNKWDQVDPVSVTLWVCEPPLSSAAIIVHLAHETIQDCDPTPFPAVQPKWSVMTEILYVLKSHSCKHTIQE